MPSTTATRQSFLKVVMQVVNPKYRAVCSNQDHFSEDLFDLPETRIIEANSWKAFMDKIKKAFEDGFEYVYMERK